MKRNLLYNAEARGLLEENDRILLRAKNGGMSRADTKQFDLNLAKLAELRNQQRKVAEIGASISAEKRALQAAHENIFRSFVSGKTDSEIEAEVRANDLLAGTATITFSNGQLGGVLVPQKFHNAVAEGMAAVDPLLSPAVSNVIPENDYRLPPLQLPGWDLSTIAATKVTESDQHAADTVPAVTQKMLGKYCYRLSLGASLEWMDDAQVYENAMNAMARAYGVGFARGIGADLATGDGASAPQGVLTGAADSGITTAGAGVLAAADFTDIFFSVNAIYRASEKCAWLMADATYKKVRNAKDSANRPLISIADGAEQILGKPLYVCPSMPANAGGKGIVFGDLSHFNVHVSTMYLRRRLQAAGYVEYGKYLVTGLMLADACVNDPTDGSMPPIVFAKLHA